MIQYEYWVHSSGERFLVRLDASLITGVCGPLRQAEIPEANRPNFDYDVQPKQMAWIKAHDTEFKNVDSAPPVPHHTA